MFIYSHRQIPVSNIFRIQNIKRYRLFTFSHLDLNLNDFLGSAGGRFQREKSSVTIFLHMCPQFVTLAFFRSISYIVRSP